MWSFVAVAVIALLVALSFIAPLDSRVEAETESSLKVALIVYASARAANGLVSVLRSAKTPLASFGEALAPIDDFVDRFGVIMEIAIGSLLIQALVSKIAGALWFKMLLAAAGIVAAVVLLAPRHLRLPLEGPLRVFALLVFLRFAVAFMVLGVAAVDHASLKAETNKQIAGLESELKQAKTGRAYETQPSPQVDPSPGSAAEETAEKGPLGRLGDLGTGVGAAVKRKAASVAESVRNTVAVLNPSAMLTPLDGMIQRMLHLAAIFVLKAILLPILFLYLLKQLLGGFRGFASRSFSPAATAR
jgi:hypothetical protein